MPAALIKVIDIIGLAKVLVRSLMKLLSEQPRSGLWQALIVEVEEHVLVAGDAAQHCRAGASRPRDC